MKFTAFYGTSRFIAISQKLTAGLYPKLDESNPHFLIYFSNIHYNIILLSVLRSSKWSLPIGFSDQKVLCISHLSQACYIPYVSHLPWFDDPYSIWSSSSLCSLLHYPAIYSSQVQIYFTASCSQTPWICVLHSDWETECHSHTKEQVKL
jgi:hypothetical protein